MGQSERESKSFENVFSNLKSSLSTFAAKVMEPFMDPLIDAMQRAGEWMSTADEKFFAFTETIKNSTAFQSLTEVVKMAIDKVKEFGQSDVWATIVTSFQDLGQAILDIDFVKLVEDVGLFLEKWAPLIGAIAGGIGAFKLITGTIKGVKTAIDLAKTSIGLLSGALTFFTSPIGLAVLAIGILIGIGILLYQNWDTIKAKLGELKDKFISDWNELKDVVGGAMTTLKDSAIADFEELKTMGSNATETLKTAAIDDFNELKNGGSNALETLKNAAVSDANELQTGASNAFNTLKNAAISDFNELKNAASSKFQEMVNAVGDKMNAAVDKVRDIGGGIKGFFDGIDLYASGKAIIQSAIDGLASMKRQITGTVEDIVGAVRDFWPFSPAKTGPLSDIHRMDFAGPIGTSIERAKKPISKSMASLADIARGGFNADWSIPNMSANVNRSVNQSVTHTITDNLVSGKQPLNATFNLGNRSFRAFVDDISNTQNAQIQLTETYI